MLAGEDVCKSPIRLATGVTVVCNQCRICKGNRVNDFAGRAVAEMATSTATLAVTLTYAGGVNATRLYYRDVQLMLKRLRSDGYSVRYIVCGEHGETKGRAHWHAILFFKGRVPDFDRNTRYYNWKYWPHGYTFAQSPDFDGISYVLKYTLKDDTSRAFTKVLRISKKPPIGYDYFQFLAQRFVDAGLPVQSPSYSFSDVRFRTGRPRRFWLTGRSRELFLEGYVTKWRAKYGGEPPMHEFLVQEYYDPIARREVYLDQDDFQRHLEAKGVYVEPTGRYQVGYLLIPFPNTGLLVQYSDGTATLTLGKEGTPWPQVFESGSAIGELTAAGLPLEVARTCAIWLKSKNRSDVPCSLSDGSPLSELLNP